MGHDIGHRRPSYFPGCMSPSCLPVHEEYIRIHIGHSDKVQRGRRLRKLLRDIVNDSKISIYGPPKRPAFQYDSVSYSQNLTTEAMNTAAMYNDSRCKTPASHDCTHKC